MVLGWIVQLTNNILINFTIYGAAIYAINSSNLIGVFKITEMDSTNVAKPRIKLIFNDGHNTGIYTWQFIYELGINFEKNSKRYLERTRNIGR